MEKKTKSKKNKKGVCEMTVMNKQNIGVLKVCASKHSSSLRLGGRRGGGNGPSSSSCYREGDDDTHCKDSLDLFHPP